MKESSWHDDFLTDRPGMMADIPNKMLTHVWGMFCGFLNEEQLSSWFEDVLDSLVEEKFRLAVYEVRNYIVGNSGKQVFFHKDSAPKYRLLRCGTQFL